MNELATTAVALALLGVLMALSVPASRVAGRGSVPVALLFLVIGMLAGTEGIGGVAFEDYTLAFRLGTVTLVLILFDGGLERRARRARAWLAPAGVLATVGVLLDGGAGRGLGGAPRASPGPRRSSSARWSRRPTPRPCSRSCAAAASSRASASPPRSSSNRGSTIRSPSS